MVMPRKTKWKEVSGFEGLYWVSNQGDLKNKHKNIKLCFDRYGYLKVCIYNSRGKKNYTIHRLVAKAFISNPENKPQVNHINGDKTDNRPENLEWVTNKENIKKGVGLKLFRHGQNHHAVKITKDQAKEIRSKYNGRKYSSYKLAEEYGVSRVTINNIVNGKTWKYHKF